MTNSEAATALPVQLPVITLSERLDITISCSVDCTLYNIINFFLQNNNNETYKNTSQTTARIADHG